MNIHILIEAVGSIWKIGSSLPAEIHNISKYDSEKKCHILEYYLRFMSMAMRHVQM